MESPVEVFKDSLKPSPASKLDHILKLAQLSGDGCTLKVTSRGSISQNYSSNL